MQKKCTGDSLYICGICSQAFSSMKLLTSHQCQVSEGEPMGFQCSICNFVVTNVKQLLEHVSHHDIPKLFKCGLCDKAFHENSSLLEHIADQHTELEAVSFYSCQLCQFKCKVVSELEHHIQISHKSFKCGICGKEFLKSQSVNFLNHVASHKKQPSVFESKRITRSKSQSESLERVKIRKITKRDSESATNVHKDGSFQRDSNEPSKLSAAKCDSENRPIETNSAGNDSAHSEKVKSVPEDKEWLSRNGTEQSDEPKEDLCKDLNFDCDECGKRFPSEKLLTGHRKIHPSNAYYSVYCQKCKKTYGSLNLLKTHLKEFGCPGYKCSDCSKAFALESSLLVHKAKAHSDCNAEELKCDKCSKTFSTMLKFSRHAGTHAKKKIFICKICRHKYVNADHLFVHLKNIHKVDREKCWGKRVQCRKCKKEFVDEDALKVHLQTHPSKQLLIQCEQDGAENSQETEQDQEESGLFGLDIMTSKMNANFDCDVCGERQADIKEFVKHRNYHFFKGKFSIQCNCCKEIFDSINDINEHVKAKKCSGFQCSRCKLSFGLQTALLSHSAKEHNLPEADELEGLNCLKCHKVFDSRMAYIRHAATHADIKSFQCNLCNAWFTTVEYVQTHIRLSHRPVRDLEEVSNRYNCDQCNSSFLGHEALDTHKKYHEHNKDSSVSEMPQTSSESSYFTCSSCPKVFWKYNALVKHMKSHLKTMTKKKKSLTCNICKKTFRENYELQRHIGTHTRPYLCSSCGKSFSLPWSLKEHMKAYHSTDNPYKCEYCDKTYSTSNSLRLHRRIHTGEKNFRCEFCDKVFVDLSYLKSHLKSHFPDKPHKCNICDYSSKHKSGLSRHMLSHRQEKKHFCPVCDKAFTQKGHVKTHMKLHSKVKNHVCSVCGSAFARKDYLKIHMRVHTNEKPYSCPVCNRAFAMSSNMLSHIKKTHPDYNYQYKHLRVNYEMTPSSSVTDVSLIAARKNPTVPENIVNINSTPGIGKGKVPINVPASSTSLAQIKQVSTSGSSNGRDQNLLQPSQSVRAAHTGGGITGDTTRQTSLLTQQDTRLDTDSQHGHKAMSGVTFGSQMMNHLSMTTPGNMSGQSNEGNMVSSDFSRFAGQNFAGGPSQDYMYIYPNFPHGPYMQDFLQPYHKP